MTNRPAGCSAAVAGADMMDAVMTGRVVMGKATTGRGTSAGAAVIKSNGRFSF